MYAYRLLEIPSLLDIIHPSMFSENNLIAFLVILFSEL